MEGSRGCDAAESWLMHQILMGVVAQGRAGISTSTSPCYNKTQGGFQVCAPVENEQISRAVAMRKQGAWARWEQAVEDKVS